MTDSKRRLVAYYRVSSDSQEDNTSLDMQRDRVHAWAKAMGCSIIHEERETCSAAGNVTREKFDRAIARVLQDDCDGLIVWDIDRYFREASEGLSVFKEVFLNNDKQLISISQSFDTSTDEGWFAFGMFMLIAELECRKIRRRFRNGKEAKKAKGGYTGGRPPYGWKVDTQAHELVENETEQTIIRRIRALERAGHNLMSIAGCLNAEGYRTRHEAAFTHVQVMRVLDDQAVRG